MSSHVSKSGLDRRSATVASWGWMTEGAGRRKTNAVRRSTRRRIAPRLVPELFWLENRQLLSAFDVTSTADDGSTGTLRWAVNGANADTSPSTIVLELGTTPTTITLTQGQLELSNTSESVAIYDGAGQGAVTISGNNASRVFQVDKGVTASISGLTITGGSAHDGGGLLNYGSATVSECTISGNSAYYGGGLRNIDRGTAVISDCTISSNSASGSGGGVDNRGNATLTDCTISGNDATNYGGGLLNEALSYASAKITDCTISGNTAEYGGGCYLYDGGTSTINNSIIAGNTDTRSAASDVDSSGLNGSFNLVGTGVQEV